MRFIQKKLSNEPTSLKEKRSTPGSNFDSCNKNDIRVALLLEQGYLCAYCMRRIDNNLNDKGQPNTNIEHFKAQSNDETLRMNYMNMLGVCDGNKGNAKHLQTCDKRRDNRILKIDPRKKNCEKLINYQDNGLIYSTHKETDIELNEVLGLNNENLVKERQNVVRVTRKRMLRYSKKKKGNQWSKKDLNKEIKYWTNQKDNRYKEYCRIAICYLEKKIARL